MPNERDFLAKGLTRLWLTSVLLLLIVPGFAHAADGPAVITRQPASITVLQGGPASFSVGVDGTQPITYQWSRNGLPISAATGSSYTLPAVGPTDHGAIFRVSVSNALGGAVSDGALLRVDPGNIVTQTVSLLKVTNVWKYDQSGGNLGTGWRDNTFDDSTWPSGQGIFDGKTTGARTTIGGETVRTVLAMSNSFGVKLTTYYFRTHVNFDYPGAAFVQFKARTMIDDGAVFYLNGKEMYPLFVNSGASYSDWATRTVGDAGWEGPLDFPATNIMTGDNVVAAEVHQINAGSSDITFGLQLDAEIGVRVPDTLPPVVTSQNPPAGGVVRTLRAVEVFFNENVEGVDAGDLLINGEPATNVLAQTPSQYVFEFSEPPTGTVQVAWSPSHGIHDYAASTNYFLGGNWTYLLDPNALPPTIIISEFLARNASINRDEDGDYSDWIELYNVGATAVNLSGWYLTDESTNLAKWRFPSVTMAANSYLLVFASGKDRTNAASRLHCNFQLSGSGEFLGLVDPYGQLVSSFAPAYPAQQENVSYGRDRLNQSFTGFFAVPTPGAANSTSGSGFAPEVKFSRPGGTFQQPFLLSLSTSDSNAVIRYILVTNAATAVVTNVPTATSPIYTGPISITQGTQVRTRAFQAGLFPGEPRTQTYIPIDAGAASQTSDMPMVLLYNFGAGAVPSTYIAQPGVIFVFEPVNGRASLTNIPVICERMGFHLRGSSTLGQAKGNFALEVWDEYNYGRDVEMLGMPAESDWIFYAPNNFDTVFIHNPFIHQLSRDIGRYSPRTRLVEVYLNTVGGAVTVPTPGGGNYNGIYVIEEKIQINKDRLDIEELQLENTTQPSVTGGYLMKVDRSGNDDVTFSAGNQGMVWVSPDGQEIQRGLRNAQRDYMVGYFNSFYAALTGPNWTNPVTGYAAYIDVDAWVDHHLLNVVAHNIDALRLSGFLHKPRNQKINMGPLWDFDRTLGSTDGRDFNPRTWRSRLPDYGTDMFNVDSIFGNPWYSKLFTDPDFWQRYIDRYQELRRTWFATNHMHALVESLGSQCYDAQNRERARWGSWNQPRSGTVTIDGYAHTFDGSYRGEVEFMKKWLSDRVDFMDTNFVGPVTYSIPGGFVSSGVAITITGPAGATIYYTTDGTDPRLPNSGGRISPTAQVYTSPIVVTNNIRLVARAYDANHSNLTGSRNPPISSSWSGPLAANYLTTIPSLRITEVMFHPAPAYVGDTNTEIYEYIEVKNVSTSPLNLDGFRIGGGVEFTFPSMVLAGGQTAVVVADITAFRARYGQSTLIAGQYTNRLNNAGESIVLEGPFGVPLLNFTYSENWFPMTDGLGFSLVFKDDTAPLETWANPESWRQSSQMHGSPGVADPSPPVFPHIIVNEVLNRDVPPFCDMIELFNAGTTQADISHWFLSDNFDIPRKFRIPAGTEILPGQFLVFYATNSFNNPSFTLYPFGFSAGGEEVYLFSADATANLTGYYQGFEFGAGEANTSFGRYTISTGAEHFVAQVSNSFNGTNAGPKVGPVVIKQVMYHPPTNVATSADNTLDEYIELVSIASDTLPLYHPTYPTNTWHLRGGIDLDFPPNLTLDPGQSVLLVNFSPNDPVQIAAFTNKYPLFAGMTILGPYSGKLGNLGNRIAIRMPDVPDPTGDIPYVLVDEVEYANVAPWPTQADGLGAALMRRDLLAYGNDPANWTTAVPLSIQSQPQAVVARVGSNITFTVVANGQGILTYQWRFNGTPISSVDNPTAASATLLLTNVQPNFEGYYEVAISDGVNSVLSAPASFTPMMAPVIVQHPNHATVAVGSPIVLTTVAKGLPLPLYFKWKRAAADVTNIVTYDTNCALVISEAQFANADDYTVTVTNEIKSAGLTSSRRGLVTVVAPPSNQAVEPGSNVTLRAVVSGGRFSTYLRYQWQVNGTNIPGATSTNLVLNNFQATQVGTYSLFVTNASNFVASFSAQVTIGDPDSNGDGIPDWWATQYGFGLNDSIAALDFDGDTMSNYHEYVAGTNPTDNTSYLRMDVSTSESGSGAVLQFNAVSNRTYNILTSDTLPASGWSQVANFGATSTNRTVSWTNTLPGATYKYYRLSIPATP